MWIIFWALYELLQSQERSLDQRLIQELAKIQDDIMTTKAEVLAAIAQLKADAAQEKNEVVAAVTAAVTSAVAAAVAPLESVIAQLEAQIADGANLGDVLSAVNDVRSDVQAIVDAAGPAEPIEPEEPTEPLEPAI